MSDYIAPTADAVAFFFKSETYVPPQPDEADFVFGADSGSGTEDAGILQSNFMILLTM